MSPVIIGDATLYCADCMDILPMLSNVDCVITDPPYEAEAHTLQRRKRGFVTASGGREVLADALPFGAMTCDVRDGACKHIAEICSGWALYFCQAEAVSSWRDAAITAGQTYKRAMVWIKPDGMPQFTGDRPGMGYESIVAAWCGSGRSVWNGGGRHGVFVFNKNDCKGSAPHPTTKPVPLMAELLQLFSNHGEPILDPFMGSGTTGVAALQLGRKFIGIEREERYFQIACKRIEQAAAQGRLFEHEQPKQKQEILI